MKKIIIFFSVVTVCWIIASVFKNGETSMDLAKAVAGKGMLSLVQSHMEAPKVAITFDDGPSKKYTPLLLDGLKERGVKASFFILGRNIEGNEELLKRMEEEGHLIGNHTYNHVQLNKVSKAEAKQEIEKTGNEIFEITGIYPIYVRPPFGEWREDLELSIELLNVPWSIDTLDWKTKSVENTVQIVKQQVKDGSIILMHDGYEESVNAAMEIIDMLKGQGYEFVTADKLLLV